MQKFGLLAALAALVALAVGCHAKRPECLECPAEPPASAPAGKAVAVAPMPRPVDPALRAAVVFVYSTWCGTMSEAERVAHAAARARIDRAGPEAVLTVAAELIAADEVSGWFIDRAVGTATDRPLHEGLRAALREWRARPERVCPGDLPAPPAPRDVSREVLEYFVRFGDETDLAWLDRHAAAGDPARRLRARLGRKERDEPTPPRSPTGPLEP